VSIIKRLFSSLQSALRSTLITNLAFQGKSSAKTELRKPYVQCNEANGALEAWLLTKLHLPAAEAQGRTIQTPFLQDLQICDISITLSHSRRRLPHLHQVILTSNFLAFPTIQPIMQSYRQYRMFRRHVQHQLEETRSSAGGQKHSSQPEGNQSIRSSDVVEQPSTEEKLDELGNRETLPLSTSYMSTADSPQPELAGTNTNPNLLQNIGTNPTTGRHIDFALSKIDFRTRTAGEAQLGRELGKVFVVGYEGDDDPMKPQNWRFGTRILATVNIGVSALVAGLASAIDSTAVPQASAAFGVSEVTESLATGLFLVGFGCSGPFAGPMSETVGRNPVYIGTLSLFMVFIMASGLSPNIGAQLVFRFIAGFFASTSFTTAGGSLSDIWSPLERIYTFPIFAVAGFIGPVLGPVMGGFIAESSLISWRWTEWTTLIICGLVLASFVLFQPESFTPILLKWKAHHLRTFTGDSRYLAPIEIRRTPFLERLRQSLYRPFVLTATEPMIILFSLYLAIVYIVLFGFLAGYNFIFQEIYHMSQGITGLLFLGIGVGFIFTTALVPLIYTWTKRELQEIQTANPSVVARLPPESRLWFAMLGAPALPISLFWMGWTAYPSVSYWSPLCASTFFGYGILTIFISITQYIIDSYEMYAASALVMTVLVRFVAAGGMVEATIPMYRHLGVHWTLTVFGCISLVFTPVPYFFYKYGPKIRNHSRYAIA
jgi:MFS family permease